MVFGFVESALFHQKNQMFLNHDDLLTTPEKEHFKYVFKQRTLEQDYINYFILKKVCYIISLLLLSSAGR